MSGDSPWGNIVLIVLSIVLHLGQQDVVPRRIVRHTGCGVVSCDFSEINLSWRQNSGPASREVEESREQADTAPARLRIMAIYIAGVLRSLAGELKTRRVALSWHCWDDAWFVSFVALPETRRVNDKVHQF